MKQFKSKLILKSNEITDELTFSADAKKEAPCAPISLPIVCKTNSNVSRVSLNLK